MTSCASCAAMVDESYPGRVIIAEANQPPDEVVEYFGTEEEPECHMAFHFPIMPRLYYALRDQKAAPIIETMKDTPDIPEGAQWGTFLRNHDELTLEMVTADERAAMLGWYAPDPRMRANIGIRRRLAPLLDNSRSEIELINALLLSLPGSPFLYYGDEIGMGDNIWLEDRDAVRTPMQWNPDRNAGFSSADPGKLYLPVIQSLVYNYSMANVEAEAAHSGSLLRWTRQILSVRKNHPAFGLGAFKHVEADHDVVLAYLRELPEGNAAGEDGETILCAFNLSQHPVATTLRVPKYAGRGLRDVFGGQVFPAIGDDGTLTLTLGQPRLLLAADPLGGVKPVLALTPRRCLSCRSRVDMTQPTLTPALAGLLEAWLPRQRWFPVKTPDFEMSPAGRRASADRPTAMLPGFEVLLTAVTSPPTADGGRTDVVQVPLSLRPEPLAGSGVRADR